MDRNLMPSSIVLEVCLDSLASAIASEKGGAQRVELCCSLENGGLTPSAGLIAMVRKRISIPMHVLIRPSPGGFCYTADEFEVMKRDVLLAKQLGANGVALGILDGRGRVDVTRTRELVELARPMSVTFNRAFDVTGDLLLALEDIAKTGANRVLTSGGKQTAYEGTGAIEELVRIAAGRIVILACGTIRAGNVADIVAKTGVREVHARLQTAAPGTENHRSEVQAEMVARFLEAASRS
jgi:copper homeostasis protein